MNKKTIQQFINDAIKVHGNKFDYSKSIYINVDTKTLIICNICKFEFYQTPDAHCRGQGCPSCAGKIKNTSTFIQKATIVHNGEYDYSLVNYINNSTKVKIICKIHGIFEQQPNNHLTGERCLFCFGKNKRTTEQFIEEAVKIHGDKYDYSLVNYINNKTKVSIICKLCNNVFKQVPSSHINNSSGCDYCARKNGGILLRKSLKQFIDEAVKIHGDKYDYSKVEYINYDVKVEILCKRCNIYFKQSPHNHLCYKGCPRCPVNISRKETKWLNSLNISQEFRQKIIKIGKRPYIVDAYDPTTNTIYEYYGDYWHGNPKVFDSNKLNKTVGKTFGELYDLTIKKENKLINAGYKIVSIWESEVNE